MKAFLARWWPAVAAHLALLCVWQGFVVAFKVPMFVLPTPLQTFETLTKPHYRWLTHTLTTATEVFGGYILAVVIGIVLALLITWSQLLSRFVMPLLVTLNMIPKIALAPLFVVWMSYGILPNIFITFTICFFPVLLTTARGFLEVEPELIDLVRSVHATRWQIFRKIQFPSAMPYVFSGMKVGAVFAVAGAVVGEFVGSERGLGFVMLSVQASLDTPGMFMAVILISLIGPLLYLLVIGLEKLLVVRDARLK